MNAKLLREFVRRVLTEAACPACGDKNAYIGLSAVECPNIHCNFFSNRQLDDVQAAGLEDVDDEYTECGSCGADLDGSDYCQDCEEGEEDDEDRDLCALCLDYELDDDHFCGSCGKTYGHCGMCGKRAVDEDTHKCANCTAGHYPDCAACGGAVDNPTACQNCGHPS